MSGAAREVLDADQSDVVLGGDDGEHALRAVVADVERVVRAGAARERDGITEHEVAHAKSPEAHMDHRGRLLGRGAEVHEHADDQEPDIDEDTHRRHDDRDCPAEPRGLVGRGLEVVTALENRAEHTTSVHRERGEQVEPREHEVHPREAGDQRPVEEPYGQERDPGGHRHERGDDRERQARHRAHDGDRELVARVFGEMFES